MTAPDEYRVIYMPFPGDIYACVRVSPDGYPTIYINAYLSPEARKRALKHELHHLEAGDFFNHVSIYDVEANAIRAEGAETCFRAFREPSGEAWAQCTAAGASALLEPERAARRPIPEALQLLRKQKRLTLAELGELIGEDAEAVRRYETGEAEPNESMLYRLSVLYGIEVLR